MSYGKRSIPTPSLMTASHEKLFQLLSGERWEFQQALLEVRRRVRNGALNIEDLAVVIDIANRMPRHSMIRESLAGDVGADKIYPESLARLLQKELNTPKSSEVGQRFVRELIRVSINEALIRNKPLLSGTQLASLAKKAQPATRLTLASLLNRLPDKEAIQLGKSLLQFDEDGLDNFQPLLIWYGIEPSVGRDPRVGFEMAETSRIPLVTQLITRRLCEEIEKPEVGRRLFGLLETCSGEYRTSVLTGIYQAVLGRRKLESPPGWADGLKKISLNEAQRELVGQINVIFGDGQSIAELVKTARKGSEDPRIRGRAIMTLAELNPSATRELLDQYLGDRDLRQYVIEAYAFCQDTDIGKKIIAQFSRLKPDGKKAAINTLSKRVVWSRELLKAIEDGKIPKGFLTAWHARQISNLGNQDLTIELEKVWGKIRQTSVEKEAEMDALKFLLESERRTSGQSKEWMSDGAKLFEKSCANCHVLYGKGGRIGPDLTGSNRKDLGYLLENIIDPSSSVAESYQASVIELVDGRTLTGVVTKQSQSIVEVQTAERKLVIDRNEIERMKPTKESLMPEGLIKDYSAEQKRALFWFLRNR